MSFYVSKYKQPIACLGFRGISPSPTGIAKAVQHHFTFV